MILVNNKLSLTDLNNITLTYGSGRVIIDGGGGYISGIEVHYTGSISLAFVGGVAEHAICEMGNNKIIIINLTDKIIDGEILHYKGTFKIDSVIVANKQAKQVGARVEFTNSRNYPESLNVLPESFDVYPEDLNRGYFYGKYRRKNKNAILSKQKRPKNYAIQLAADTKVTDSSGQGEDK